MTSQTTPTRTDCRTAVPMTTYAQRRTASLQLPPVDLRSLLTPDVRAQGPRPLCVPFSVSVAHEAARATTAAAPLDLAVEPLWQCCVQAGAAGHDGTTLHAVADAATAVGQTLEEVWPYNSTLGSGTEPTPAAAIAGSFNTAEVFEVPLTHDGIEQHLEDTLVVGLPVVVVLEVTAELEAPDHEGEIDTPPLTAPVGDYHAVVAVGAATGMNGTSRRLLVRNSWGPGWGAGGYGWLPYDYLVNFAVQAGAVDPTTLATR